MEETKCILIILVVTSSLFFVSINIGFNYAAGQTQDLTGIWHANDGGTYYIRQIGSEIWWFGTSGGNPVNFANVFHGTISGVMISGTWADVPMGATMGSGDLTLQLQNDGRLYKTAMTGGFSGSTWTR